MRPEINSQLSADYLAPKALSVHLCLVCKEELKMFLRRKLIKVQCTVYSVHCTLYTDQSTVRSFDERTSQKYLSSYQFNSVAVNRRLEHLW